MPARRPCARGYVRAPTELAWVRWLGQARAQTLFTARSMVSSPASQARRRLGSGGRALPVRLAALAAAVAALAVGLLLLLGGSRDGADPGPARPAALPGSVAVDPRA